MIRTNVVAQVMATVNAPYGTDLSAHQLAAMLTDMESADKFSAPVFSFFSELPAIMQKQFLQSMGVDEAAVRNVACECSRRSGYALPLVGPEGLEPPT